MFFLHWIKRILHYSSNFIKLLSINFLSTKYWPKVDHQPRDATRSRFVSQIRYYPPPIVKYLYCIHQLKMFYYSSFSLRSVLPLFLGKEVMQARCESLVKTVYKGGRVRVAESVEITGRLHTIPLLEAKAIPISGIF